MWSIVSVPKLLPVIVCVFALSARGLGCKLGYLPYGERCVYINTREETFITSQRNCELKDSSQLVSLSDEGFFHFIKNHSASVGVNNFWVGMKVLNDSVQWMDGTDVLQTPWIDPVFVEDEKPICIAFDGAGVRMMKCWEKLASICEAPKNLPNETNSACEYLDSHSYLFRSQLLFKFKGAMSGRCIFELWHQTFHHAPTACTHVGGEFIDLDDIVTEGLLAIQEKKALVNQGSETSRYWTKLKWNGTHILWSSGNPVGEGLPTHFIGGNGSCITASFDYNRSIEVHLYQTECDEFHSVVCAQKVYPAIPTTTEELPQSDARSYSCPVGYNWKMDSTSGYCYWETSFETERLSWTEAEAYCKSYGGHLASFHSVEDEKIGLSFQYGSLSHAYWIGLFFDTETEMYKWSDGSPSDYSNWAPGHPNHRDKQLRCVAMEAAGKHWKSSLCGILSWFVCKAPKQINPPTPVLPTPTPMQACYDGPGVIEAYKSYYFRGSCYFTISDTVNWHRARQYCENQGYTLASIHSAEEVGFLLKLLYDHHFDENRVWIGLNSLGPSGSLRWTDHSPLDFTYFNENEPDNYQNLEKCCNMLVFNGMWNDENCNVATGFICKRANDTSSTAPVPTTPSPLIGNCKKGWLDYVDRCYLVGGVREQDRLNWTEALSVCHNHGSYLTSVRDETEQAFLAFLLQTLRGDAWIGLHDTVKSGHYYWVDNSEMKFTRWSPGEPSFFGLKEDCVLMAYHQIDSGMWKDAECDMKLGYICQSRKDPTLPEPSYTRGIKCLHPEGWLKLDNMCFKMNVGNDLTWSEAESSCQRDGGHLVSIFDNSVRAVTQYLSTIVQQPFWIGLRYKESTSRLIWLNNWPMSVSKWEKGEPSNLFEDTCFASTTEGYWKKYNCDEQLPYVCQITTGRSPEPEKYTGSCPITSSLWVPSSGSYCYILDPKSLSDFFKATLTCYRYGSQLVSIHSLEEIESLKKIMDPGVRSVRIGLMMSSKGGFSWTDSTPVDFVFWDEGEPATVSNRVQGECVEMVASTMRWRMTDCTSQMHFICQNRKSTLTKGDPEKGKLMDETSGRLSTPAVTAIVVCVVVVVVLLAAVLYYRRNSGNPARRLWHPFRQQSVSFENALYDVDSATMQFQEEGKT